MRAVAVRTTAAARGSAWASSIGVLIAIYLGSGVFVVQDGQVGVVIAVRQVSIRPPAQGMHWRLPYPFESHEIVKSAQIRSVKIGRNNVVTLANVKDASLLTHDADIVDVRFAVQYQVQVSRPTISSAASIPIRA